MPKAISFSRHRLLFAAVILAWLPTAALAQVKVRASGTTIDIAGTWQVRQGDWEPPPDCFAPRPQPTEDSKQMDLCLRPDHLRRARPRNLPTGWDLETFLHLSSVCGTTAWNHEGRGHMPGIANVRVLPDGAAKTVRVTADFGNGAPLFVDPGYAFRLADTVIMVQIACAPPMGEHKERIVEAVIRTHHWRREPGLVFFLPLPSNLPMMLYGRMPAPKPYFCELRLTMGAAEAKTRFLVEPGVAPPVSLGIPRDNPYRHYRFNPFGSFRFEDALPDEHPWPHNWLWWMSQKLQSLDRLPCLPPGYGDNDWPYTHYSVSFAPDSWRGIKDAEGYPVSSKSSPWPPSMHEVNDLCRSSRLLYPPAFEGPLLIFWDVRQ